MAFIRGWTEHCKYLLTWFFKIQRPEKTHKKTHTTTRIDVYPPVRSPLYAICLRVLGEFSKSIPGHWRLRTGWKYVLDVVKFIWNPRSRVTRSKGHTVNHLSGVDVRLNRKLERRVQQFCQIQKQHLAPQVCSDMRTLQSPPALGS